MGEMRNMGKYERNEIRLIMKGEKIVIESV